MTRLNNTIRQDIINNALKSAGLDKVEQEIIARRAKLAEDVRLFSIGGPQAEKDLNAYLEKIQSIVDEIPEKIKYKIANIDRICPRSSYRIMCNFAGRVAPLHFNGDDKDFGNSIWNVGERVYKNFICVNSRVDISADNPLNAEFNELENQANEFLGKRSDIREEVRAIVSSVNTTSQLLKIWPEAKDLLPKVEKAQNTLPTVQVDSLNKMLNLPPETE